MMENLTKSNNDTPAMNGSRLLVNVDLSPPSFPLPFALSTPIFYALSYYWYAV